MKNVKSNKDILRLTDSEKAYLTQVALTNPELLPKAMLEVMNLRMRQLMIQSVLHFLESCMNKLGDQNK